MAEANSFARHKPSTGPEKRTLYGSVLQDLQQLVVDDNADAELGELVIEDTTKDERLRIDGDRFRGVREELKQSAKEGPPRHSLYDSAMRGLIPVVIVLNSIMMGYSANHPTRTIAWVEIAEQAFTAFFAQEMFVALCREGLRNYFHDEWRYFDFALAWLSIVDSWILVFFVVDGPISAFLVLRVLRVLRIIRLLRLLRVRKELQMMTGAIMSSIQTTCWMMVLLLIVIFTASLFCLSAIDLDAYEDHEEFNAQLRFGTVPRSMLTLFNIILLDGWADLIWPMFVTQPSLVVFLIAFLMFTSFGAMNVVVAIVTEQAMLVSAEHQEREREKQRRCRMRSIVQLADTLFESDDGNGLTCAQLTALALSRTDLQDELHAIEFPRGFAMDDLHLMFDSEYSQTLSKDEFINGLFRLIFNNDFQRDCCVTLQVARLREQGHESFRKLTEEMRRCIGNSLAGQVPKSTTAMGGGHIHDFPDTPQSGAKDHVLTLQQALEKSMSMSLHDLRTELNTLQSKLGGSPLELSSVLSAFWAERAGPEFTALYEPLEAVCLGQRQAELSLDAVLETLAELQRCLLAQQRSIVGEVAAMVQIAEPALEEKRSDTLLQQAARIGSLEAKHSLGQLGLPKQNVSGPLSGRTMFAGALSARGVKLPGCANLAPCVV